MKLAPPLRRTQHGIQQSDASGIGSSAVANMVQNNQIVSQTQAPAPKSQSHLSKFDKQTETIRNRYGKIGMGVLPAYMMNPYMVQRSGMAFYGKGSKDDYIKYYQSQGLSEDVAKGIVQKGAKNIYNDEAIRNSLTQEQLKRLETFAGGSEKTRIDKYVNEGVPRNIATRLVKNNKSVDDFRKANESFVGPRQSQQPPIDYKSLNNAETRANALLSQESKPTMRELQVGANTRIGRYFYGDQKSILTPKELSNWREHADVAGGKIAQGLGGPLGNVAGNAYTGLNRAGAYAVEHAPIASTVAATPAVLSGIGSNMRIRRQLEYKKMAKDDPSNKAAKLAHTMGSVSMARSLLSMGGYAGMGLTGHKLYSSSGLMAGTMGLGGGAAAGKSGLAGLLAGAGGSASLAGGAALFLPSLIGMIAGMKAKAHHNKIRGNRGSADKSTRVHGKVADVYYNSLQSIVNQNPSTEALLTLLNYVQIEALRRVSVLPDMHAMFQHYIEDAKTKDVKTTVKNVTSKRDNDLEVEERGGKNIFSKVGNIVGDYGGRAVHGMNVLRMADPFTQIGSLLMGGGSAKDVIDESAQAYLGGKYQRQKSKQIKTLAEQTHFTYQDISAVNTKPEFYLSQAEDPLNKLLSLQVGAYQMQTIQAKSLGVIASGMGMGHEIKKWGIDVSVPKAHWIHHIPVISTIATTMSATAKTIRGLWTAFKFVKNIGSHVKSGISKVGGWARDKISSFVQGPVKTYSDDPTKLLEKAGLTDKRSAAEKTSMFQDNLLDTSLRQLAALQQIEHILGQITGIDTSHIRSQKLDRLTGNVMSERDYNNLTLTRRNKLQQTYKDEVSEFDKGWYGIRGKIRKTFGSAMDTSDLYNRGYTNDSDENIVNRSLLHIVDPKHAQQQEQRISDWKNNIDSFRELHNPSDFELKLKNMRYIADKRTGQTFDLHNPNERANGIAAFNQMKRENASSFNFDLGTRSGLWARDKVGAGPGIYDFSDLNSQKQSIESSTRSSKRGLDVNIVNIETEECLPICNCSDGFFNINISSIGGVSVGSLSRGNIALGSNDSHIIELNPHQQPELTYATSQSRSIAGGDRSVSMELDELHSKELETQTKNHRVTVIDMDEDRNEYLQQIAENTGNLQQVEDDEDKDEEKEGFFGKYIKPALMGMLGAIAGGIGTAVLGAVVTGGKRVLRKVGGLIAKPIKQAFNWGKNKFKGLFTWAKDAFKGAFKWGKDLILGGFGVIGKHLTPIFKNASEVIIKAGKTVLTFLTGGFGKLLGLVGLGGAAAKVMSWGSNLFKGGKAAETGVKAGKAAVTGAKATTQASKILGKEVAETAGKQAVKKAGKLGLKSALKKIPGISLLVGLALGLYEASEGNYIRAVGELASGIAGSFPGIGTGLSLLIDGALMGDSFGLFSKKNPHGKSDSAFGKTVNDGEASKGLYSFRSKITQPTPTSEDSLKGVEFQQQASKPTTPAATLEDLKKKEKLLPNGLTQKQQDELHARTLKTLHRITDELEEEKAKKMTKYHTGGPVKETGPAELEKGEFVLTKEQQKALVNSATYSGKASKETANAIQEQKEVLQKIEENTNTIGWFGGNRFSKLNQRFAGRWNSATQEFHEKTGKRVQVTDDWRSYAAQVDVKRRKPNYAAKPGNSRHGFGFAIDANSRELIQMDKMGILKKYGLWRPLAHRKKFKEPWHVEPIGLDWRGLKKERPSGKHPGSYYDKYLPHDSRTIKKAQAENYKELKKTKESDSPQNATKYTSDSGTASSGGIPTNDESGGFIGNFMNNFAGGIADLVELFSFLPGILGSSSSGDKSEDKPAKNWRSTQAGITETSSDGSKTDVPRTAGANKLIGNGVGSTDDKTIAGTASMAPISTMNSVHNTRSNSSIKSVSTSEPPQLGSNDSSTISAGYDRMLKAAKTENPNQKVAKTKATGETYTEQYQQKETDRAIAAMAAHPQQQVAIPNVGRSVESVRTSNERTVDPVSQKIIDQIFANTIVSFQQSINVFASGQNPFTVFR